MPYYPTLSEIILYLKKNYILFGYNFNTMTIEKENESSRAGDFSVADGEFHNPQ